ncbi:hypothetical protein LCM17_00915 [Cereibacter sphaeroides]|nr:hypothetical protein [Cereibacter sphaeroides]
MAGVVLLGFFQAFLLPSFGVRFVAAQAEDNTWAYFTSAVGAAAGAACLIIAVYRFPNEEARRRLSGNKEANIFILVPLTSIFVGLMASTIVTITVPMVQAALFGEERELEFIVTDRSASDKSCRRGVELYRVPLMLMFSRNKLCGVQDDFLRRLHDGDRVVVFGYGTDAGIFYHSYRRVSN